MMDTGNMQDLNVQKLDHAFVERFATDMSLRAQARASVVSWRWATESMGVDIPFSQALYGGPRARWLRDESANPDNHVHHGLDAAGRIVLECERNRAKRVWLYGENSKTGVSWYLGEDSSSLKTIDLYQYRDQHLISAQTHVPGRHMLRETFTWQDGLLVKSFCQTEPEAGEPWYCQHLFIHDAHRELERIVLQYTDADGVPSGQERLEYLRLPKGETLATVEKRVEAHFLDALPRALAAVPRDQPLYCLLLCYTAEDMASAWPPFLVWGQDAYRQQIAAQGEDISYYLWAPDEIREQQGRAYEYWFDAPELKNACLLHAQLMGMKQSHASATRVLKRLMPAVTRMVAEAGLPVTADFVVSYADNSGYVDPLKAIKASVSPEHWTALKKQKFV